MVQLFRLRHSSLRLKIPLFSLLGLFAILFGIGISTGITSGAPLFSTPVTAAQGRFISDVDMHTRKDGLTFVVGTAFTVSPSNAHIRNYLSLTVLNNGSSYASSVNADANAVDLPVKYPSIAFSPVDGTGYIAFRTNHGQGSESDLRVIPTSFNGGNNVGLGAQIRLKDKLGYQLDQPAVAVKSDGNIMVAGYAFIQGQPVRLRLVTLDKNTFNVIDTITLDTQAGGQAYEMDPAICIDPNNNVTVASMFPYGTSTDSPSREYAYTGINSANFVKTDITPQGWIVLKGGKARDIVCAPDGTVYVAINNRGQFDLYKRTPGAGGSEKWAKTATNVFQIYADAVAVSVSSDGKVWAAQADGQDNSGGANANNGANVKFSTDGGFTFSANERAIPQSNNPDYSRYIAIDANPYDNKVHLILSTQYDYDNFTTQYAYAITATPPNPPTNLAATTVSTSQINLSWTASNSSPDSYKIYRSTSQNGAYSLIAQIPPGTNYQNTNLPSATTFFYKVSAVKANLEGAFSNIASATTLLGAPTSLSAIPASSSQINLNWAAPFPAPDGYNIYRSDTLNGSYLPIAQNVGGTSYSNINLPYNATYYYKVTAVKAGFAESASSNIASATTLTAASVVFTTQPGSGVAGAVLGTQPVIKVVDINGNTVTNFPGNVNLSLTPNTGNPSASLTVGSANPVTPSSGIASFTGVAVDAIGASYKLRATTDGGAYGDSAPFDQTGTMTVSDVPNNQQATVPFNLTVTIKKNGGATDTKFNGTVYLNLNNVGSAYYYGRTAVFAVNGVATFNYLMIDTAANGYSYTSTIGNNALVPTDTNNSFNLVTYTVPGTCSRFLYTNSGGVGSDTTCSKTSLAAAITASTAPNPNVPLYVDHRATGFGTDQVQVTAPVSLPDGVIIDGGCPSASAQGVLFTISNNLTISGNNHYLRGIFFQGVESGNPLFKGGTGNIMSCDKLNVVP